MNDEFTIGDQVKLLKNDTYVAGRVRGIRLDNDGVVDAIWLEEIKTPFYFVNGWHFVEVLTEAQIEEINNLNRLLEDGENGDI